MKNIFVTFGVCALAALSLAACEKPVPGTDDGDEPVTPTLSTDAAETITFAAAGGDKTVTVTTNQESWNVTLTPADGHEWLTVSKGEDTFTLTATANEALASPAEVMVVVTAGNAERVQIMVGQEPFVPEPTLSTDTNELLFEAVGHGLNVMVTTNQPSYEVALSPEDGGGWLTLDPKNIKGANSFSLIATRNTTPVERGPVTVTVTAGDATPVSLTARQQAAAPQLSTNAPATITFLAEGGNSVVDVTTNYDAWDAVLAPADGNGWLTIAKTATSFTLTAVENTAQTEPTPVTVTVSAGEAVPVTITVKQDAADAPLVYYRGGDYYPDADAPEGVVWYIDPSSSTDGGVTGLHGKVVSLDQSTNDALNKKQWVGPYGCNLRLSMDDGKANTDAVVAFAAEKGYVLEPSGAFGWCIGKGEGWYLPAFNELRHIYAVASGVNYDTVKAEWGNYNILPNGNTTECNAARSAFNAKITAKGGMALFTPYEPYWASSSDEYNLGSKAWSFQAPGSGTTQGIGTNPGAHIRAVKIF